MATIYKQNDNHYHLALDNDNDYHYYIKLYITVSFMNLSQVEFEQAVKIANIDNCNLEQYGIYNGADVVVTQKIGDNLRLYVNGKLLSLNTNIAKSILVA